MSLSRALSDLSAELLVSATEQSTVVTASVDRAPVETAEALTVSTSVAEPDE